MTPPTLISVINQSKRISDVDIETMSHAVGRQLAEHAAPVYGLVPAIEFVRAGGTPTAGGCPCFISDVPDADGVLGYHYEQDDGTPAIKVFANPVLDNGGFALKGSLSVSAVLSHEALELMGDAPANKWADGPNGDDYAYELCDPVQGDSYEIDAVSVSNFVLQSYFDAKAPANAKLDYLGKLKRPFSMTSGGYLITRTEPGSISNIFGASSHEVVDVIKHPGLRVHFGADFPEWRKAGALWKASQKRARRAS